MNLSGITITLTDKSIMVLSGEGGQKAVAICDVCAELQIDWDYEHVGLHNSWFDAFILYY